MCRKAKIALFETRNHQHLRDVPVVENRVSGEILRYFAERGFECRFAASAGNARLRIADDPGAEIDDAGIDQRFDGEVCRCWITTGVGNESSGPSRESIFRVEPSFGHARLGSWLVDYENLLELKSIESVAYIVTH